MATLSTCLFRDHKIIKNNQLTPLRPICCFQDLDIGERSDRIRMREKRSGDKDIASSLHKNLIKKWYRYHVWIFLLNDNASQERKAEGTSCLLSLQQVLVL